MPEVTEYNYVTVYKVTRHYGGPEEGGWWYNWYDPVYSEPFTTHDYVEKMRKEWQEKDSGDIYSVLGGVEYVVHVEEVQLEGQSTEVPHYE